MSDEQIEVEGRVMVVTAEGIQIKVDGEAIWFPQSMMTSDRYDYIGDMDPGEEVEFTVPEFIAIDKGLI